MMLKTYVFPMLFLGGKKSKKSRRGAPKGSKSDFEPWASGGLSDFGPPGRPHYQRSKYISLHGISLSISF